MLKKPGIIFVTIGAVLMLSALLLVLYNGYEAQQAGEESAELLEALQTKIVVETVATELPEETVEPKPEIPNEEKEPLPAEMPEVLIDGDAYIGWLSIPVLELELPVMSDWDYPSLRKAPCRHFGSSRTDDLVIAAHNYATHFGSLSTLEDGTAVAFTDMDGIENQYTLQKVETLPPDAVDAVQNSGYDLVLYTCTPGGATRVAAFCNRAEP